MEVLEGLNVLVCINGRKNKLRVYYLSWLRNKIVKGDDVSCFGEAASPVCTYRHNYYYHRLFIIPEICAFLVKKDKFMWILFMRGSTWGVAILP